MLGVCVDRCTVLTCVGKVASARSIGFIRYFHIPEEGRECEDHSAL